MPARHKAYVSVTQPVSRAVNLKPKEFHAHGCSQCSRRYGDACAIPDVNGRCSACHTARERPVWDRDADPKACCRTESKQMKERAEVLRYRLGGPGPWYRCSTCSRTHPFNPSSKIGSSTT